MAPYEPPHQDIRCLQIQLFSTVVHVVKDFSSFCSYIDDMREFWDNHDGSNDSTIKDHEGHDWEKVVDNGSFKLWRCPVPNSHLYQYKGTYNKLAGPSCSKHR